MRRRFSLIAAILLCLTAVLAGCGTKDAESVVKELDKTLTNLGSYHGKGTMTLFTGQQPLEYQVDVSYQKPQYYRIALTNAKKDITQIVLRNDEGVFVLTPRLNKVFRFQSDWPANQGQVYLYQTLVQSILLDNSRQFAVDNDAYVFDVMANYQNGSLARQKIWLNKSDYAPSKVEVSDANAAVMVSVKFDSFEFGSKLEKSVFDTQTNMGAAADKPTTAEPDSDQSNTNVNAETDTNTDANTNNTVDSDATANPDNNGTSSEETDDGSQGTLGPINKAFTAMEPSYLPDGVSEKDQQDIVFGGNAGIIIRYAGSFDYTLIQTQPKDVAVSAMKGDLIDLGFTYGSISGDEQRTLTWTYDGTEFRITTGNLPQNEMIKVAQSVQGEMSK
ncbi:outer membrane lipoprotein-sorting protein [Paenibacillus sp. BC26]|uniref:outer membrane lipoprotein-sorting protein n=1 Tax=Paenibacillus sp. BC26 TaxID=1881032 RepID=UPI0008E5D603|nr:outer membrane lipoprotein-sorting protein [Paenibacillus sp. BC26]SFT16767.1 Outer membrane lipoprotein-sorting protein [Paenibacillus sp. BC26]